ncbi:hypothetical protein RI844_08285 [Thalassotalea fonticola]|uniref:Glycosyltransferase RgtA/B/C/D-like domain-containing protein n=1 Tax=Thalassotalea fonticola TaxID=3065649 RepID=A0ABZ0GUY9_9GAMM|nr:hypothetical protein RI844_08285 [Colwelliaceae bacterium S1-1]
MLFNNTLMILIKEKFRIYISKSFFKIKSAIWLIPLLTLFSAIILNFEFLLNHDTGWLFLATKKWLSGAALYSEIIEVNPPLIFIIFSPIVYLTELLEISSVIIIIKLYLILLICIPSFFFLKIILNLPTFEKQKALITTIVILLLFILPMYDFGQRDHIAFVFLLPYLTYRYIIHTQILKTNLLESVIIGVLAGVGLCLKPYLLFLPLFTELFFLYKNKNLKRMFSIEFLSMLGFCLTFLIYILYFERAYIELMIPLGKATYWTYGIPLSHFGLPEKFFIWIILFFIAFKIKGKRNQDILFYGHSLTLGALLSFLLQSHFNYQILPFNIVLSIMFLLTTMFYIFQFKGSIHIQNKFKFLILTLWISIFLFDINTIINRNNKLTELVNGAPPSLKTLKLDHLETTKRVINQHFFNKNIYVLSTNVWPSSFISNYTHANWSSGFPAMWPLPAIDFAERYPHLITKNKLSNIESIKLFVTSTIAREITKSKPEAIIIDVSEKLSYSHDDFNYLNFFSRHDNLSQILKNYELSDLKVSFFKSKKYVVFIRKRDISI